MFGGAVSWCLKTNRGLDLGAILNEQVLLDATALAGGVLVRLGGLYRDLGVPLLNGSPIFRALFPGLSPTLCELPTDQALERVAGALADCRRDLEAADMAAPDADVVFRELAHAINLAEFAVDVLRARQAVRAGTDSISPDRARQPLRRLEPLLVEQRACWLLRSRPGGLDDSLARIDQLRHELTTAAHR